MIPIVTPTEMAAIDAAAPEPVDVLIGRAGWAVARSARRMLGGTYGRRVVVIAGRGNNGADGRVAGMLLQRRGVQVTILDPTGRPPGAADPSSTARAHATENVTESATASTRRTEPATLPQCDLIIDAAYGTGLSRPYRAPRPADAHTPVLAVDIPSGISGLTGERLGTPLRATETVTFAAFKPGLLIGDGPAFTGTVECVDIGLDTSNATAHLVTGPDVARWLPTRRAAAHKWNHAVRLVGGSPGMSGSIDLATAAALRSGSGYVRRSTPGTDPADPGMIGTGTIEAVTTPLKATGWASEVLGDIERFGALAVGPGLGTRPDHLEQVRQLVAAPIPIVIDGDGLRALGDNPASVLTARPGHLAPVVLTPHDAEFVRLGGAPAAFVDRFEAVRDLARTSAAVVLRKGPTTLVAHPDGRVLAVTAGDERLATAGTGDVLTGVVAALLARGLEPFRAAAAAAWVHGQAATQARRIGFIASDLPELIADLLSAMREDGSHQFRQKGADHDDS